MSIIDEIIPEQGFEKVLTQIGIVLFDEFTAQFIKQALTPDFSVFIERTAPYDKSENVMINVNLENIGYDNQNETTAQGKTIYNIDLFVSSQGDEVTKGHTKSQMALHKYMGWIRYILSSHKYKTLGLPLGLIGGTTVENLQFDDNYGENAAGNVRMARGVFSVRILENQELWDGIELAGNTSQFKLDQTDLGYKLIKNF